MNLIRVIHITLSSEDKYFETLLISPFVTAFKNSLLSKDIFTTQFKKKMNDLKRKFIRRESKEQEFFLNVLINKQKEEKSKKKIQVKNSYYYEIYNYYLYSYNFL